MGDLTPISALILGIILGMGLSFLAYGVRRFVFQLLAGVMRGLSLPLLRPLMRLLGLSKRVGNRSIGTGAAATAVSKHKTLTDEALGDEFDHEHNFMQRRGLFFRWLSARVGFMRMPEELSDELAQDYYNQAKEFLGTQVPVIYDPHALFEDIEGAVIAKQFFQSDKGILFYMNETRKMMNKNVRMLALWFSSILTGVLLLNIILNATDLVPTLGIVSETDFLGLDKKELNSLAFGGLSCVVSAVLMWALYYTEYTPYQRNTAREMSNILTRYLARVNDHYRTAVGKAKAATVGEERTPEKLSESARLWTTNLVWIALRAYFIESYVRNVAFQIRRNSSYYLTFVPAGFFIVMTSAIIVSGLLIKGFTPLSTIASLGWVFLTLFILVGLLYTFFLTSSMAALDEIDQGEWISFHTLKLDDVLGDVVGKYAEEVGYWKNRVGGGI